MSGNFQHCLHPRAMTTAEAAQAMAKLAHLATQGMALALGLWRGTVTGTESGNPPPGEHVAVFTDETLFAPFGPRGNQASKAGAVLLILAARHAQDFARALPAGYKPGGLSKLCQPVIDGLTAEKSPLDDDMLSHLVALADNAAAIQASERELHRSHAALRVVLEAFDHDAARDTERCPIQATALRAVYDALRMPWPNRG